MSETEDIRMAGHVRTWAEHDAVEDAAWRAPASTTSTISWLSPGDR
jgi:hypothetical protein